MASVTFCTFHQASKASMLGQCFFADCPHKGQITVIVSHEDFFHYITRRDDQQRMYRLQMLWVSIRNMSNYVMEIFIA